jgi:hypothetical protein
MKSSSTILSCSTVNTPGLLERDPIGPPRDEVHVAPDGGCPPQPDALAPERVPLRQLLIVAIGSPGSAEWITIFCSGAME